MATLRTNDVTKGQKLILWQKDIGYVLATAAEDKGAFEGLAYLHVFVNSEALPGVTEMTINTNTWAVHDSEDVEILKKIVSDHVRPHLVR